jgi:hypothetical protein
MRDLQTPATHELSLVAGDEVSGSSPLVGSLFFLQILQKQEAPDINIGGFGRSRAAVDSSSKPRPLLWLTTSVCGTAGGVGESSGFECMTGVPEFPRVRRRRKGFARVPRRKIFRAVTYAGSRETRPTIAQRGASGDAATVRRAICGLVCSSARLIERGSVHSCSQYATRPPLWHTQRTPPSCEITTATDPGNAPASR